MKEYYLYIKNGGVSKLQQVVGMFKRLSEQEAESETERQRKKVHPHKFLFAKMIFFGLKRQAYDLKYQFP